jgi:hypothetical protein
MKQIGLRIKESLLSWLLKQAEKENRTLSNYIITILLEEKNREELKNE